MLTCKQTLVICCLFLCSSALMAEGALTLRFSPEMNRYDQSRLFHDPTAANDEQVNNLEADLLIRTGGLTTQAGLIVDDSSNDRNQGYLYELFYDGSIAGFDYSIGKKRVGFGVGYAYRPLDMIQQEQRQTLRSIVVEGVPLISVERFSDTGNVGLLYVNHLTVNEGNSSTGDEEWAVRGYNLLDNTDLQWLIHQDSSRKTSVAAGFSWVGGESLELHGSFRLQSKYDTTPAYSYDVVTQMAIENRMKETSGVVALVGMTWTFRNGLSLIGEYWQDQMAPDTSFWNAVLSDLSYLKSGGAITAQNAAAMASLTQRINYGYSQSNVVQKNLFLRLSYDGVWADPSVDILYHPDDRGYGVTVRVAREFSQSQHIEVGIRQLDGASDSLMGNIGEYQQAYISWEYSYGI